MAIAEWKTDSSVYSHGYADYALFIGEKLVGVIEAKAAHKVIPGVIDGQCKEYAGLIRAEDSRYVTGSWFPSTTRRPGKSSMRPSCLTSLTLT